jgi:predicted CoA-substrate-specific enzyme activase
MICAGVDAGSRQVKVVVLDCAGNKVRGATVADQGVKQRERAHETFERCLDEACATHGDLARIVATGYGRHAVDFADETLTEISCHARGIAHLAPEARTVIDIGGQDSKLIRLDGDGNVLDFAMNDRCAGGTGCFLEMVARRLDVSLERLGVLAASSSQPAPISSMCVVFAETEIVGLLAGETPSEDIVAGVQRAIARRIASMAGRALEPPVAGRRRADA